MGYKKYKNQKCFYGGIKFDSQKEARRYAELLILLEAGEIHDLKLQETYLLIPAQYEEISRDEYVKSKGKKTKGKCLERAVKYKADFVYYDKIINWLSRIQRA